MTEEVYSKEDIILQNILSNSDDYARKVLPFIEASYFEKPEHKAIFNQIKKHLNSYNAIPSKDALIIDLEENEKNLSDDEFKNTVHLVKDYTNQPPESNIEWLEEQTEKFCKDKALYNAVLQTLQIIDDTGNTKENISSINEHAIPDIFQEALNINFSVDLGIKYKESFEEQYEYYHQRLNKIPFRNNILNNITNGGVNRKSLNVLLGVTGVGKTRFVVDQACDYASQGYNVVYFTMEMAKEEIRRLIDANQMDIPVNDLDEIPYKNYMKKADRVKSKVPGEIFIEEYGTGVPNANIFHNYLKELEQQENVTPDIIVIDYLNICSSSKMSSSKSAKHEIINSISKELRSLGQEWNCAVWSPTQFNRCLSLDTIVISENGEKRIDEIYEGERILSTNNKYETVNKIYPKEKQKVYKIKTKSDKEIKCSSKHIFPTEKGEKSIESGLNEGDRLFVRDINRRFLKMFYLDEIEEIEELDKEETVDITISGNNLFYANKILTHNSGASDSNPGITDIAESWDLTHNVDFLLGAITSEDLEKMEPPQIKFQQMKSRYGDLGYYNTFNLGIDRSKSKFFEINDMATGEPVSSSSNEDIGLDEKSEKTDTKNKLKV